MIKSVVHFGSKPVALAFVARLQEGTVYQLVACCTGGWEVELGGF